MPRKPSERIVTHRIELSPWERERFDTLVGGWTFNRISSPLVEFLSEPKAILALVGLLEAAGVLNIREWVKDNTYLDEWYNAVVNGLFSGWEDALAALDDIQNFLDDPVDAVDPVGRTKVNFNSLKLWAYSKFLPAEFGAVNNQGIPDPEPRPY